MVPMTPPDRATEREMRECRAGSRSRQAGRNHLDIELSWPACFRTASFAGIHAERASQHHRPDQEFKFRGAMGPSNSSRVEECADQPAGNAAHQDAHLQSRSNARAIHFPDDTPTHNRLHPEPDTSTKTVHDCMGSLDCNRQFWTNPLDQEAPHPSGRDRSYRETCSFTPLNSAPPRSILPGRRSTSGMRSIGRRGRMREAFRSMP